MSDRTGSRRRKEGKAQEQAGGRGEAEGEETMLLRAEWMGGTEHVGWLGTESTQQGVGSSAVTSLWSEEFSQVVPHIRVSADRM